MADHYAANAIVFALEEFDVRCEVLRDQRIVGKADHRHLFVRIHFAGPDAGKMLETSDHPGFLQASQVDSCIPEHFAGRPAK